MDILEIEMPKGYMNIGIDSANQLVADTNDSTNWDTMTFPLPKGRWTISSQKGKMVWVRKKKWYQK